MNIEEKTDLNKQIEYLKAVDPRLSKVIDYVGILDYSPICYSNSFVFLVKEIVGQMISANVKKILFDKLVSLCANDITPSNINKLSVVQLRSIGLSKAKISYIHNLANIVIDGDVDFCYLDTLPDGDIINRLTSIKGIGNWTAKMYLLFFLQREDVLPYEDGAFLQTYKWLYNTEDTKPESIVKRCKKWKPYTSIGARYMYRALDEGLTKIPIKQFLEDKVQRKTS